MNNFKSNSKLHTFLWIWAFTFAFCFGFMVMLKAAERLPNYDYFQIGISSIIGSSPLAIFITVIIITLRTNVRGTKTEEQLNKLKGLRIGILSFLVSFAGAVLYAAFKIWFGKFLVVCGIVGVFVGLFIHFFEIVDKNMK